MFNIVHDEFSVNSLENLIYCRRSKTETLAAPVPGRITSAALKEVMSTGDEKW